MKTSEIYTLLGGLDETLIVENLPPSYAAMLGKSARLRRHPLRALGRFLESGWGIAASCAIVSIAVLVAIVMAGRTPPPAPPAPPIGTMPGEQETSERQIDTLYPSRVPAYEGSVNYYVDAPDAPYVDDELTEILAEVCALRPGESIDYKDKWMLESLTDPSMEIIYREGGNCPHDEGSGEGHVHMMLDFPLPEGLYRLHLVKEQDGELRSTAHDELAVGDAYRALLDQLRNNELTTETPDPEASPYYISYITNRDGTCAVKITARGFVTTLFDVVIPEKSPDGDIVVAWEADFCAVNELLRGPHSVTADTFERLIKRPLAAHFGGDESLMAPYLEAYTFRSADSYEQGDSTYYRGEADAYVLKPLQPPLLPILLDIGFSADDWEEINIENNRYIDKWIEDLWYEENINWPCYIRSVTLPATITSIHAEKLDDLRYWPSLEEIRFGGTAAQWADITSGHDLSGVDIVCEGREPSDGETSIPTPTVEVPSLKDYFFTSRQTEPFDWPSQETNENGDLLYGSEFDPSLVPRDDRSALFNTVYSIRLTPEIEDMGTFYTGISYFHYRGKYRGHEELLLVYLEAPSGIDLVLVFETYFGNTEDFRMAVTEGSYFPARLINCQNAVARDVFKTGVGHIGNQFDGEIVTAPLDAAYREKVAFSGGFIPYYTSDDIDNLDNPQFVFKLLDENNPYLQNFFDYLNHYGINEDPTSDLTKAE